MAMKDYVKKNYKRLENDFKVIMDLPLDKEIPDKIGIIWSVLENESC